MFSVNLHALQKTFITLHLPKLHFLSLADTSTSSSSSRSNICRSQNQAELDVVNLRQEGNLKALSVSMEEWGVGAGFKGQSC